MSINIKPNLVNTDRVDDTQTINSVDQMYTSFVRPIDTYIRSIKDSPGLGTTVSQSPRGYNTDEERAASRSVVGGRVDPVRYNESRCHAFFRNVGFPVVAPDGSFYNPGHDPNQAATVISRQNVNNKLNSNGQDIIRIITKRETDMKDRRDVFSRQDDVATVYALLLRKTRPFLSAQTGQDPLFADDQQTPINSRTQEIDNLNIDATKIPGFVTNVSHILKPFIVNPDIDFAVEPEQTKRVAVPFLGSPKELVTGFDENGRETRAIRPLIEEILRNRLQVREIDEVFVSNAQAILNNAGTTTDATGTDIRNTLLALSGEDTLKDVNQSIIESIQDFTTLESTIASTLIKGIKVAVNELNFSIRDLEKVRSEINLQPIPGVLGPEFPQQGRVRTAGGVASPSELQQKVADLNLQKLVNQRLNGRPDERIGERAYISAISVDLTKSLDSSIDRLQRKLDELGRKALNLIATIEKITGEISGIGIVDILAIYTALYTIDIKYLIGMLDSSSLTRLDQNFHELVNNEVFNQLTGNRPSILECLKEFEKIFFNILAFADSLIVTTARTPVRVRRGSVGGESSG